jgi:O-methyltransferase
MWRILLTRLTSVHEAHFNSHFSFFKKMSELDKLINGPGWLVTYNADGLATVHNCDFTEDPKFVEAYRLGAATMLAFAGADVRWRVFVCCWAAHQAKLLGGDFVECGVNTGVISRAVMYYIAFNEMPDRKFYLLDTYAGIPLEQITAIERDRGIENHNKHYPDCYAQVRATFAPFKNARVIRGRVPDTLEQIDSNMISYVSMDMNIIEPEIAAGEFLWPRMISGGIIVLDDYGWRPHIGQKHAWDEFAEARGQMILALPTGQGLLIKL